MKVFYYVFCIVEFVSINIILIEIFIDVFLFNFVFKSIPQFFEVQYVFHYSFLFIFDNDNLKKRVFLIRQWIDNDKVQKLKVKNVINSYDFK